MNIFFFIYKEPDLYCYLPIGLELKRINKNLNIILVFCNKSNYTNIIEDDFIKKILHAVFVETYALSLWIAFPVEIFAYTVRK